MITYWDGGSDCFVSLITSALTGISLCYYFSENILPSYSDDKLDFWWINGTVIWWIGVGILLGIILLIAVVLCWNKYVEQKVRALTEYLEKINTGKQGLLLDASEDEFSKLQDEIYKTITTLYQTRDAAITAKRNFADNLYNIAHQLKTPITAISLSIQMMKKEEVDVFTLLTLASDNLQELCSKNKVFMDIPETNPISITADLEWTMEAVMNLLKNCMEHSAAGMSVHCSYAVNPLL